MGEEFERERPRRMTEPIRARRGMNAGQRRVQMSEETRLLFQREIKN